ncbi:DUF1993 domain-containing protein [Sphingomonas crusticola]|uniref:DUF1993 domain-containing protein n=1 Tax=Sphingomonas crusticola TaxID=1697973 RepID=UPI0019672873|nr:DUF1993 domain-containing protein [Sphingomonas crusticola]
MLSLYDISVPVFIRAFRNMDAFLAKGADWFAEQGRPESELTTARLIADMAPLTGQIQRASDSAKGVAVRVGGVENVAMADEEVTIADLRARIARTIAFLEATPRDGFDGKEDATVEIKTPNRTMTFSGRDYVLGFAVPNFFFHVTTAYALLRREGVPIGKMDYLGAA